MLDDILSQMSQRDISSTQLFRSNSEHFNNVRRKALSNSIDLPSFDKRALPQSSYGSQWNQKDSDWFAGSSQLSQSRHLQPSLLYNEEEADYEDEEIVQDSPELFTQHGDLQLHGPPFNRPDLGMEDSEGTIAHLFPFFEMAHNFKALLLSCINPTTLYLLVLKELK